MQTIQLYVNQHKGEYRIFINAIYSNELNTILKKLSGVKWSQTRKQWHMPVDKKLYMQFHSLVEKVAEINNTALKTYLQNKEQTAAAILLSQKTNIPETIFAAQKSHTEKPTRQPATAAINAHVLPTLKQALVLKAYSPSTIKTYCNEMAQFLQNIKNNSANAFGTDRIKKYLQYCFEEQKLSENTLHSRMNALKFYYEQVLKKEKLFWEIPRPKKQLQLPHFFNQDEITAIIKAAGNIKHKTMLMLAYSSGLRVSEVISIKTKNIDSKRMCILINQAKGKKDRMVALSPVLLIILREYWKKNKPSKDGYLFQGQYKDEPYSSRSLQLVLAAAKKKAGVLKPGSIHALRHSFATHLLDKGTDITMIMKLLGHNDIKTTLRYLHVTNRDMLKIISPLDNLKLD